CSAAHGDLPSFPTRRSSDLPTLCAKWLPPREVVGDESAPQGWGPRLHARVEMVLYFLTRNYQRLLAASLRRRATVLVAVALLFADRKSTRLNSSHSQISYAV